MTWASLLVLRSGPTAPAAIIARPARRRQPARPGPIAGSSGASRF